MKYTSKKITTETRTYTIGGKLKFIMTYINGVHKPKMNKLLYGKDNRVKPRIFDKIPNFADRNPFYDDNYGDLDITNLSPMKVKEYVDNGNVVLCNRSTHTLFDMDMNYIPSVYSVQLDAESYTSDMIKYLSSHPLVKHVKTYDRSSTVIVYVYIPPEIYYSHGQNLTNIKYQMCNGFGGVDLLGLKNYTKPDYSY